MGAQRSFQDEVRLARLRGEAELLHRGVLLLEAGGEGADPLEKAAVALARLLRPPARPLRVVPAPDDVTYYVRFSASSEIYVNTELLTSLVPGRLQDVAQRVLADALGDEARAAALAERFAATDFPRQLGHGVDRERIRRWAEQQG